MCRVLRAVFDVVLRVVLCCCLAGLECATLSAAADEGGPSAQTPVRWVGDAKRGDVKLSES